MIERRNYIIEKLERTIKLFRYFGIGFIIVGIYGTIYLMYDLKRQESSAKETKTTLQLGNGAGMFAPDTLAEIPTQIKASFRKYGTKPIEKVERQETNIVYTPEFQPRLLSLDLTYDTIMVAGINGLILPYALQNSTKGPITFLVGIYNDFDLFSFDRNKILLKFLFVDNNGNYVGHVFNNELYVNPSYNQLIAFDDRGLEIFDTSGNMIFSFFIAGPKQILFQGYLYDFMKKEIHVYGPKGMKHLPINCSPEDIRAAQRIVCAGRLYNYPANININTRLPDSLMPRVGMRPPQKTF